MDREEATDSITNSKPAAPFEGVYDSSKEPKGSPGLMEPSLRMGFLKNLTGFLL